MVSVIIPTYNNADTIVGSIRSVLRQTVKKVEVIVIDDGSNDSTKTLLKPFVKQNAIKYIWQENKGQGAARNLGARIARGNWLAFLDADDEWFPEKLATQLAKAEKKLEIALWFTNAEIVIAGKAIGNQFPDFSILPRRKYQMYPNLLKTNYIVNSTVMMKKDAFHHLHGFDESPNLRRVEDYDLWLRTASHLPIQGTDQVLVRYKYPTPMNQNINTIKAGLLRIYQKQIWSSPWRYKYLAYQRYKKTSINETVPRLKIGLMEQKMKDG